MAVKFTWVQSGAAASGSGNVALALGSASTAGTLLVAVVVSTNATTPFTAPAGWQPMSKAVQVSTFGRLEIWYYPGNTGGLYGPGHAVTFTGAGTCRGAIAEFSTPPNTRQVLEAVGQATGTGGATMALASACGNAAGCLAISVFGDFFSSSATGTFTTPGGSVPLAGAATSSTSCWQAYYNTDVPAGYQSLGSGFSTTSGEQGWGGALAVFRCVVFQPVRMPGAEMTNCLDLDPTGQVLIAGGDVEGTFRSADYGNNWQPTQAGKYTFEWLSNACVAWSLMGGSETGNAYACVSKDGTGGGFMVSADGGNTWAMRSQTPQFWGNAAKPQSKGGPRPDTVADDSDRSVGRLIAQDPGGGYMYVAANQGGSGQSAIFRSQNFGSTWTGIGLASASYCPRSLVINNGSSPNPAELWAATWDFDNTGTYGGVWHTTNAHASPGSVSWAQLPGFTGTVAELKLIGTYLFAACDSNGIWVWDTVNTGWTQLPGVDTTKSIWTTVDGWFDGTNYQIVAGCSKGIKTHPNPNYTVIVQLKVPSSFLTGGTGSVTVTDLTGASVINTTTLPDGSTWWHAGGGWQFWLGGSSSNNPHVLIDPNTTSLSSGPHIYSSGAGGFFRTTDGGAHWQLAVTGMDVLGWHMFSADPNTAGHIVTSGDDFISIDLTDPTGITANSVQSTSPPNAGSNESHAGAFDPVDSTFYLGENLKYSQPGGGGVYSRPPAAPFTWSAELGYAAKTSAAVIGLFAGRDSGNNKYLIAVAQATGVYRGTLAGSTWTWTLADNVIATSGNLNQTVPIVAGASAGYLYAFDRDQGVYRSTNYGQSWSRIWTKKVTDKRSGRIAINPNVAGELWATTDDGVWKITGAGGGSPTPAQVTAFPPTTGGAIAWNGTTVYVIAVATGTSQPSSQLLGSVTGGATWFDAGGDSFSSIAATTSMSGFAGNYLVVANDEDTALVGVPLTPSDTGQATFSATASLSALGQDTSGITKHGTASLHATASLAAGLLPVHLVTGLPLDATATLAATTSASAPVLQQVNVTSTFDYGFSTATMTTQLGSTLVLVAGWDLSTSPTSAPMPAVWVTDSAGNLWEHVETTSASVTGARCSAWICTNARPITWISCSATTFCSSLAWTVLELDGTILPQYYSLDLLDATSTASAASLMLGPGTASDADFCFAVLCAGGAPDHAPVVTGNTGWQALTSVAAGTSGPNPVTIFPYYQPVNQGTGLATTFTVDQALPVAGIVFAIHSTVYPPYQQNEDFPVLKFELGFGYQPGDPTQAPPPRTDITNRVIIAKGKEWCATQAGRQYELATPEAGTINLAVDNHDGALTPGAPQAFPGLALKNPLWVSAWWDGFWYPVAMGYVERYPQTWPDLPQWGLSTIVATDAIGAAAAVTMFSALDSDILLDQPYVLVTGAEQYLSFSNGLNSFAGSGTFALGYFTAADAQGLTAQNYSRINQRNALYVDGVGLGGLALTTPAIAATGQTTNLLGSSATGFGTTAFSTTAPTAPISGPGALYTDPNLPDPLDATGVTVCFGIIISTPAGSSSLQPVVFTAWGAPSNYSTRPSFQVQVQNASADTLQVTFADGSTVTAPFSPSATPQTVALTLTSSSLNIYVNGVAETTKALTGAQVTAWQACAWGCPNYAYGTGTLTVGNYTIYDAAIYPYVLPQQRIVSQTATAISGQQNVDATARVAQILSWAGLGLPRGGQVTFGGAGDGTLQGPAYSLAGQTASAALAQVAANRSEMITVSPAGSLVYWHRFALFNQSPVAVLGDSYDPTQGQIPYLPAQSWDYDDSYLWATQQVVQQYGANSLLTVQVTDTTSQEQYFNRTPRTQTITTMSDLDATSQANWLAAKYSQPSLRVAGVTIDAAANPDGQNPAIVAVSPNPPANVFATVLALQQGQVVTVTRNPLGGAPITQNVIIQKISHSIGPGQWRVSLQLSPYVPEATMLQLDEPGSNEVGFAVLA